MSQLTAEPAPEAAGASLSATQTHFSWLRTRLSIERTFLSWTRTAVSLIGFGFTIYQFLRTLARAGDRPDAARRARAALIGEEFFALEALEIARRAEAMPPAERFDFLARWVLPGADHDAVRLYAAKLLGRPGGDWRMTGIDPEGLDLRLQGETVRLDGAIRMAPR